MRSGSRARAGAGNGGGGGGEEEGGGFEIMANVVWSEIGRALMDELGGVIFAAGKPDEFRKVSCGCYVRVFGLLGLMLWCSIASRDDAGVHPCARVPRAFGAVGRCDAQAYRVRIIRAALAAASLLPITVEGDRHEAGRGLGYD